MLSAGVNRPKLFRARIWLLNAHETRKENQGVIMWEMTHSSLKDCSLIPVKYDAVLNTHLLCTLRIIRA